MACQDPAAEEVADGRGEGVSEPAPGSRQDGGHRESVDRDHQDDQVDRRQGRQQKRVPGAIEVALDPAETRFHLFDLAGKS